MEQKPALDENGHEVGDPTPIAMPAGFKRPETLAEQVQRLVRTTISTEAAAQGDETFDEADDFDVDDEVDPSSPYEAFFDPVLGKELTPHEFKQHEAIYRERYLQAQREYFASLDRQRALHGAPPSKASGREATASGSARSADNARQPRESDTPEQPSGAGS